MMHKTQKNHYEVLQVDRQASPAVIRGAYLALLKTARNHPDLGGSDALAQTINAAFSVLSDAEARRDYDRELGPARDAGAYPVPVLRTQYILICPSCRKRNLVDDGRMLERMKCGACKAVLLPPRRVPMENDHARAYRLGIYLFDKGLLDRSLREFEAAVRLNDRSPQYHYWLGRCLYRMHQLPRSRQAFQAAVTLNPRRFHFQFWLGQINYTMRNFPAAVTCFAAARKARPRHSPTLLRMASCYFQLRQFAKAIAVLEAAIRQEPTRLQLYTLLGVVYLASRNPSAALQAFRHAERLSPGDAFTRRYIDMIQQR
jgi:tetratricopeptide (TPR) repeat protein